MHFDNFLFVQIHLDVFTCWRHLVIEAQSNCVVITQKDESKMAAIFRAYNRIMVKQPFLTQCVTCGLLVASGDVISQKVIENQPQLNIERTVKFAAFGLLYIGPAISIWYRFLDRSFGVKKFLLKPWQKVIADQTIFSPQINLLAIPVLGLLNSNSLEQMKDNVRNNYVDIMIANYKIWPAVQMVNFYLVPLNYRVVFASFFSLIWNTYYTWKMGEKTTAAAATTVEN